MQIKIFENTPFEEIFIIDFSLEERLYDTLPAKYNGKRLITHCKIFVPEESSIIKDLVKRIGWGNATCAPLDKFSKARGRMIALYRAMHGAKLDRGTRLAIVEAIKEKGCKLWK
ncbi:hypothetical protein UFOVP434_104 [uncultured Caudovirales phage]|uniref:Uncharacterized protein n=1 Tax=uncultured Caudovirales phage TaxID=2100421 RepID=A0A6J5MBX1_9CAUD|nr:hypothetical protein UFOVP434_104 [uncultured Caudovirales phage]